MTTLETLGRMNAKCANLTAMPQGFERLSAEDLAHALSFVHGTGPRLLGRVRYARHEAFRKPLEYELLQRLKHAAQREQWRNIGLLPRLATLAVSVVVDPRLCRTCGGRQYQRRGGSYRICPACGGHSVRPISNAAMARTLGVTDVAFAKTWQRRLGLAQDILGGWERRCYDGVARAMASKRLLDMG